MTEAGWTSTKPTEAGWYWWRWSKKDDPEVLWLSLIAGKLRVFTMSNENCEEYVDDYDGEWLGPISPDSFQQGRVAGLREAEEYALRCLKELQDKIRDLESGKCVLAGAQTKEGVEAWVHAKTLEASRIAKWITARIIEQQAQEGGVGDANG